MIFKKRQKATDESTASIARSFAVSYIMDKATGDKYIALNGEHVDGTEFKVLLNLPFARTVVDHLDEIVKLAESGETP